MGLMPREQIERIRRKAVLRGLPTGEAQRQNGRPVEFVTMMPNNDGGDTIVPFGNPRPTNTFNSFRSTLPTLPRAPYLAEPGLSNGFQPRLPTSTRATTPVVAGPSNFFHPQSSTNSRAPMSEAREASQAPGDENSGMSIDDFTALEPPTMKGKLKRRQDSAFANSPPDSNGLEPDAGFEIERRSKTAKLATGESQVQQSPQSNLRMGSPHTSTPERPQASATPRALFVIPREFFASSQAVARPQADASPEPAASPEVVASTRASASPEPLASDVSNAVPLQGTATPGPSLPLSSIQTQSSATPGLPSASTPNTAPPQTTAAALTTRQVSLHRDMTPYVGARPIPQWLTDLAREIRAADADPQGRPKTAALKKVTNTFVRDGETISHFSPASGVLRVGNRWSPLWEWWMDTRVLTPAQWWRVNEVNWKMKSEGYKELPAGCHGTNVPAV